MTRKHLLILIGLTLILGACVSVPATPPPATPRPIATQPAPDAVALTLHREGGVAGFCDDLTIYADGKTDVRACDDETAQTGVLTAAQAAQFFTWLTEFQPFDRTITDGPVADSLTLEVSFKGQGPKSVTDDDLAAISAFAQQLLTPTQAQPPGSSDSGMTSGLAAVQSVEVQVLSGAPTSLLVIARGAVPDGCTSIDETSWTQEGNTFIVTITTIRPADMMCTQALVPFEETVMIEPENALDPGAYTVEVNGVSTEVAL